MKMKKLPLYLFPAATALPLYGCSKPAPATKPRHQLRAWTVLIADWERAKKCRHGLFGLADTNQLITNQSQKHRAHSEDNCFHTIEANSWFRQLQPGSETPMNRAKPYRDKLPKQRPMLPKPLWIARLVVIAALKAITINNWSDTISVELFPASNPRWRGSRCSIKLLNTKLTTAG